MMSISCNKKPLHFLIMQKQLQIRWKNSHLGIFMKNRDSKKWFKTAEITSIVKINVKLQIYICIWFVTCKFAFFLIDTSMALVHSELQFWLGRVRLGWVLQSHCRCIHLRERSEKQPSAGAGVQGAEPPESILAFILGNWLFSINREISCKNPKT